MNLLFSGIFCLLLTVTRVIDGDTIAISTGETVRLIGVDAPESRNSFHKVKARFGEESKKHLTDLLLNKKVFLEFDVRRKDRYGRTLAYVYLQDSSFVNAKMVRDGYATVMTVPPNVRYAEQFVLLQNEARNEKRGLWRESEK